MRAALILASVAATLASQGVEEQRSSIRRMLAASGLVSFAGHLPAYELDRPLTSSSYDHNNTSFVAAVYFVDEMEGVRALGPLHLLRIDKDGTIWRAQITEPELYGTARSVAVGPAILVETHVSPSAGRIAVFTPHLKLISVLNGYGAERLPGGSILYRGSMVHFADLHQASVHVFEPSSGSTTELLPATDGPPELRNTDRSVRSLQFDEAGSAVAFALGYSESWYGGKPFFRQTVARCHRVSSNWTCRERLLTDAAREFGIELNTSTDDRAAVSAIVTRELRKK